MTHPYFVAKAREVFARAGGDPDRSGPLAAWAEEARGRGDSRRGVVVAQDGTLVASTVRIGGTYCLDDLLVDVGEEGHRELGLLTWLQVGFPRSQPPVGMLGGLERVVGQPVIEVRYVDVCSGASRDIKAV